jgi:ribosomal protein S11
MKSDERTELTPEERVEIESLPRERQPGRLLEERTLQSLRARGVLKQRNVMRVRIPWLAAGLAASVALFVSGVTVGQWVGSRTVVESMATAQQQTAMQAAAAVQRAGSAYVTALMAFAAVADSSSNGAFAQGREAALNALYAAAFELVQIDPTDPVAVTIREGLEQSRLEARQADNSAIQSVVWF